VSILNSIRRTLLSLGFACTFVQRQGVATPVATTNIVIPATGSFTPVLSCGKIRVKNATVGAASTSYVGKITATDGTNVVQLYPGDLSATAAGQGLDEVIEFNSDLQITSITVPVTVTVAACTHDVEVAGNS
jgi:hypothetical protein